MKFHDLETLLKTHSTRDLRLVASAGGGGAMHLNGSTTAMVTELLRLANLGLMLETAALHKPRARANAIAAAAEIDWRDLIKAAG